MYKSYKTIEFRYGIIAIDVHSNFYAWYNHVIERGWNDHDVECYIKHIADKILSEIDNTSRNISYTSTVLHHDLDFGDYKFRISMHLCMFYGHSIFKNTIIPVTWIEYLKHEDQTVRCDD